MEPINNEQKYRKTTATINNKTPNTHAGNCRTCLCHNFKLLSHAQRQTDKMRQTTTTATTTATATRDIRAKIQIQIRRYFRCIGTQQQPFFSREEELNLRFLLFLRQTRLLLEAICRKRNYLTDTLIKKQVMFKFRAIREDCGEQI